MKRYLSRLLPCLLILTVAGSRPAGAQNPLTRMGGLILSAYAGGGAFSDLQRSRARAELIQPPPNPIDFTRRLSPETSLTVAIAAGYWFNESWGFRLNAGLAPTRFEVSVSERERAALPSDTTVEPRAPFARLNVWSYDAVLLARAPFTPRGRVAPYGLIGGGVLRYRAAGSDPLPPEAAAVFDGGSTVNRVAIVIGVGAIVPLQRRNLALTFELTDHLSKTPVERAGTGLLAEGETIRIVMAEPNVPAVEGRVNTTNYVRLLIGISWLRR